MTVLDNQISNLDYYPTINEVDCSRGAPMGRGAWLEKPTGLVIAFRLPIDAGGYDLGSAYWGTPNNVFCITDGKEFRVFSRADTLQGAIDEARVKYASLLEGVSIVPLLLGDVVAGYVEAMLFARADDPEIGEDGEETQPWSTLGVGEIAPEFFAKIRHECRSFLLIAKSILGARPTSLAYLDWKRIGIDFYYTSNGHGVGFSDYPEVYGEGFADQLHEAARKFGGFEEYLGDDGRIYG